MMPADFYRNSSGLRHRALTLPRQMLSPEKKAGEVHTMTPAELPPVPPSFLVSFDQHAYDAAKTSGAVGTDEDVWGGDDTVKGSAAAISHGLISLMGRRRVMVDAVTALSTPFPPQSCGRHRFFAVYGGSTASGMCKERLHHLLAEEMGGGGSVVEWERVMKMSFARMEKEVCESNEEATEDGEGGSPRREAGGRTTAVVAVVSAEELVVASCGHTKAVLCRGGVAIPLPRDHKATPPSQPEGSDAMEAEEAADQQEDHYLEPCKISVPEVTVRARTPSDDFLILASKSLWDVLPSDAACELVKSYLIHEQCSPKRRILIEESSCTDSCAAYAAAMLAEMAVARGSKDNVSVVVVMFDKAG